MLRKVWAAIVFAGFLPAGMTQAQDAQQYPLRPVSVIIPSDAGSGTDAVGRLVADALSKEFGQPFVVENVTGGGATLGTAQVARAEPDGYTLLMTTISSMGLAPLLRKDLTYTFEDFAPIGQINSSSASLVVNPEVPAKSLPELVQYLKDNPGKLNFGTNGYGSILHMETEIFMAETGTEITHVPFKGGGEVNAALLGGHIDLAFTNLITSLPQIEAGKLRAIAVNSYERDPVLPDVPTLREVYPDIPAIELWIGLFAPANTPEPVVEKISAAMGEYLRSPEGVEGMAKVAAGSRPVGSGAEEFAERVRFETEIMQKLIEENDISIE